jgi:hypothetical protein
LLCFDENLAISYYSLSTGGNLVESYQLVTE